MPHNRFYAPDLATLSSEEQRHLRVMRTQVGDIIELVDGVGTLAEARLTSTDAFEIISKQSEPAPASLILAQAIPRRPRLDLIIEKGTELGATQFLLFPAARSERPRVDLPRLQRIAIAAMKQCGSLYLPKIEVRDSLPLDLPSPAVYGAPGGPALSPSTTSVLIGPESGLTSDEESQLQQAGILPACCHRNTLRTDTAGLAALAILSHSCESRHRSG